METDSLLIMLCMLIKERPWYLEPIKEQSSVDHWLSAHFIRQVIFRQFQLLLAVFSENTGQYRETEASRKGLTLSFFSGRLLKVADRTE